MKQIQIPNEVFIKTLGYQKPTNDKLRLLAYSLIQKVPEGVLLFNTLTSEMLLLDTLESNNIYNLEYLYQHWFVVPESFNDLKFAKQFRSLFNLLSPQKNIINNYTILTTMDCNARCFYCYEQGRARIHMSCNSAEKVSDYIVKNYLKYKVQEKDAQVYINWFGGEPLYNNEVIYLITERLNNFKVPFKSHMISNGYLFDEKIIIDAKTKWNLKKVQITLDGTEKIYNKTKSFIYEGVNAYERVLNNIELLLKSHIRVFVRMNIDMYNADDLIVLSNILAERFGHSKGFKCYSHPLFEVAGTTVNMRTEDRREAVYQKQNELIACLDEHKLSYYSPVPKTIRTNYCMADSSNSVVITPSGSIGLCEHFTDTEQFSHLDNLDLVDKQVINSFREICSELDICNDCAYYPLCVRLKKCPEGSLCFPQTKKQRIEDLKKSMLKTYERWQKKEVKKSSEVYDIHEDDDDINAFC